MLEQKALSARVDFLATAASNFPQEGAATLRAAADKMEGK